MKKLWFLSVLTAVLAGCSSSSVNTISNADVKANIQPIVDRRIYTDDRMAKALTVTELRESKTNDGFMRVQIFLKNRTSDSYHLLYRFVWTDENGVEVESLDNPNFVAVAVLPGDDLTLTSIAPQKNCRDFKVRLMAQE